MIIDKSPSQAATSALQAVPFSSLIGAPLNACIDAQAMAAKTTWDFIENVGLEVNPDTGEKTAVNVSFLFMQGGRLVQLNVPLLTIIPIPYIAIHSIDINFKANISASLSTMSEQTENVTKSGDMNMDLGAKFGPFHVGTKMNASYSSKKDSKATSESKYSVEYTMDVAVKAGQDSMPAGLAKVLELLGNSLDVSNPKGTLDVNGVRLIAVENEEGTDKVAKLIATYKSSKGLFAPEKITISAIEEGSVPLITEANRMDGNLVVELPVGIYNVSVGSVDDPHYKSIKINVIDAD